MMNFRMQNTRAQFWREYHEATKHSGASLRKSQRALDWANMPDPFRHYENVPIVDLPADPSAPAISTLDVLLGIGGSRSTIDGPGFLSQVLFYSAAISASKLVASTGHRYQAVYHFAVGYPVPDPRISAGGDEWQSAP